MLRLLGKLHYQPKPVGVGGGSGQMRSRGLLDRSCVLQSRHTTSWQQPHREDAGEINSLTLLTLAELKWKAEGKAAFRYWSASQALNRVEEQEG